MVGTICYYLPHLQTALHFAPCPVCLISVFLLLLLTPFCMPEGGLPKIEGGLADFEIDLEILEIDLKSSTKNLRSIFRGKNFVTPIHCDFNIRFLKVFGERKKKIAKNGFSSIFIKF